jgi:hypothetical protein
MNSFHYTAVVYTIRRLFTLYGGSYSMLRRLCLTVHLMTTGFGPGECGTEYGHGAVRVRSLPGLPRRRRAGSLHLIRGGARARRPRPHDRCMARNRGSRWPGEARGTDSEIRREAALSRAGLASAPVGLGARD